MLYKEGHVIYDGTPTTSHQKLLMEKTKDEDTTELGPRPEYFEFGKNHGTTWATS